MAQVRRRLYVLTVLSAAVVALTAAPAVAHVELESAFPADGVTLTEQPGALRLTFSGPLEAGADHSLGLFGPGGERLDDDATTAISETEVEATVPPLPGPGQYTVRWRIAAADGDGQDGSYTFSYVGAPGASAPPSPGSPSGPPSDEPAAPTPPAVEEPPPPTPEAPVPPVAPSPSPAPSEPEDSEAPAPTTDAEGGAGGGGPLGPIAGVAGLVAVGAALAVVLAKRRGESRSRDDAEGAQRVEGSR